MSPAAAVPEIEHSGPLGLGIAPRLRHRLGPSAGIQHLQQRLQQPEQRLAPAVHVSREQSLLRWPPGL